VPFDRIEINARRGRDTAVAQHGHAKIQAVVRHVPDVRVDIKSPVRWRDAEQTQAWQRFQQQLSVARISRDMSFQLLATVERHEPCVLTQRWRRQEQAAHVSTGSCQLLWRNQQPAQAPADHAEIFREAIHDQGVRLEFEHGVRRPHVAESVINLVRQNFDLALATHSRDRLQFSGLDDGSGWIGRACDDDALGRRIEGSQARRGELKSRLRATRNFHRLQMQCS
jgi:hypothetical protein